MPIPPMVGVLAAAAAAGLLLTGCGTKTSSNPAPPPPAARSVPVTSPQQQHNQADVVFVQNMVLHHTQAITMSQIARNQASAAQVKDLATRIEAEQSPQIEQMNSLLSEWGIPAPVTTGGTGTTNAVGHGQLPGTVSGAGFDRAFLEMMIVDHQDAVDMSQIELAQARNPATRNLAQQIISADHAQISEMQTLLQVI
ncbi:MAG TPA: DUF305 domain-containing protein [Pseudonocardiaceae bacterium]|nr:DUF305 domain-containing protein [Pseudonocardiaceae bacterium]